MSEWTDADVERVSDALNTITRGGLHDPLGLARALLASGVVVPARVVEAMEGIAAIRTAQRDRIRDEILPALRAEADLSRDELRGIKFRVEVACDGFAALMDSDVPGGNDLASYQDGAAAAAEAIRTALLAEGRDRAGEGAAFREGECAPRKCSCMGHVVPGVEHFTPCCDEPHVTAGEGAGSSDRDSLIAGLAAEPVAMTLSHDRLILQRAEEGSDAEVVVVRCPHTIGLCFDLPERGMLGMLPCPCNDPSEIVARIVPESREGAGS